MIKQLIKNNAFKILSFVIIVWFVLSCIRTIYNFSKVYTEEISWINLSDNQKKIKLFGNLHVALMKVKNTTPISSNIIFLSTNPDVHYLGIYYLYPRGYKHMKYSSVINCSNYSDKYEYIAVYRETANILKTKNCPRAYVENVINYERIKANLTLFKL